LEIKQRQGIVVRPVERLSEKQIRLIDQTSRTLLEDPGLLCYSRLAAAIWQQAGAKVENKGPYASISIPSKILDRALETAPAEVVLGARVPENRLILNAHEPRVRFGSGAETNVWLDVQFDDKHHPIFARQTGSIDRLRKAAHLCEHLEHLDFFIRCVNIQDEQITAQNKDVNKFLASLNHITKHVQAGLTDIDQLDAVIELGQIIAGGVEAFQKNPVLSFITCVIKSPLQMVDDTAEKLIAIAKRGVPVVVSSCPMGGATGPFDETGMVALINAELLAGIALTQLANPGTPVLYGAVPVRTRLDSLQDMYGAPEFVHYNLDCAQMARFYGLPCYSTAGVGDNDRPGIQASLEKLMTYFSIPKGGAQYIHYAFGLLERTNMFCPEQAVMDDAHIGIAKRMLVEAPVSEANCQQTVDVVREIMRTDHKTFMYHLPLPTQESVYTHYPLEHQEGGALYAAHQKYLEILDRPSVELPANTLYEINRKVPGILPQTITPVRETI